jgi:hypothetical protein
MTPSARSRRRRIRPPQRAMSATDPRSVTRELRRAAVNSNDLLTDLNDPLHEAIATASVSVHLCSPFIGPVQR